MWWRGEPRWRWWWWGDGSEARQGAEESAQAALRRPFFARSGPALDQPRAGGRLARDEVIHGEGIDHDWMTGW